MKNYEEKEKKLDNILKKLNTMSNKVGKMSNDINPLSFKKAIIDPVKVIAPIAAPKDISTRLAILILPTVPKLKTSGFKNAEIATKTAAKPTRLWKPATSSGIAVIGILKAIKAPIDPPIINNKIT